MHPFLMPQGPFNFSYYMGISFTEGFIQPYFSRAFMAFYDLGLWIPRAPENNVIVISLLFYVVIETLLVFLFDFWNARMLFITF